MAKINKKTTIRPAGDNGTGNDAFGSLKSFLEGEEKERQRLSRELHDGIGQSLIAIKMKLESLLYVEAGEIRDQIARIQDEFDKTVDEIRRISNNLMPSVLEAFGIVYALRNLCVETSEQTGLKIGLEFKGDFESLNKTIKTYLFRVAQEALANIVRHSGASIVELNLARDRDLIRFTIKDNGRGFRMDELKHATGHGLKNMRDRVNLLYGSLELESIENQGTRILISIPVFV